ncbi:BON domain-containing protein [Rubrivivax albus]|uniref:BON domain-containing protein n=1 Tax=Rubrivivax albus TaxID=2499835 RepID=A0A3S2U580_9BURK|nr:BON domain-containing protein [Rubrivivax albus]RVT48076.1 BON domain-containing protein [Rubrivivax albus]
MNFPRHGGRPLAAALLALGALTALPGCAPLIVGGAMVGGVLVATDRRTTGAQVEDQGIELKAGNRVKELATLGHVNVTSYNRMLLLTGEVPDETQRARVEESLARVENVKSVVNELTVAGNSSTTSRANDLQLGLKVKASFVDAKDVAANAVKVVVERGNVYLMGRVTEAEAARAADLASRVPGVVKVVRVFELISEEELARMTPAAK